MSVEQDQTVDAAERSISRHALLSQSTETSSQRRAAIMEDA